MATPGGADAGKLLISNATPCVWKLTDSKKHNMPVWEFPEEVNPGETVVALIQFGKDGGGNPGPSGVACYQVSNATQPFLEVVDIEIGKILLMSAWSKSIRITVLYFELCFRERRRLLRNIATVFPHVVWRSMLLLAT